MTAEPPQPLETENAYEAVSYIASLTRELSRLAKSCHLDSLGYLLDMAHMEASQLEKGWPGECEGRPRSGSN